MTPSAPRSSEDCSPALLITPEADRTSALCFGRVMIGFLFLPGSPESRIPSRVDTEPVGWIKSWDQRYSSKLDSI